MGRFLFVLLLSIVVVSAACIGPYGITVPTTSTSSSPLENTTTEPASNLTQTTSISSGPKNWNMSPVWHLETTGIPFMDMSPDGTLSAVVDFNSARLYLIRPNGESVIFNVGENEEVEPVIAGVAVVDGVAYVLGSYEEFAGVKKYSWNGFMGEERHGWAGSVADDIARSPNGAHFCYIVTTSATSQELYCDRKMLKLTPTNYKLNSVSDSGIVVVAINSKAFVFKNGIKLMEFNTSRVIAYQNRILVSREGELQIFSEGGELLKRAHNYTFELANLLRWTLLPTGKYLFRYEPLSDTHVLTWNLTKVRTLPGFPYFANENFVVTGKDRTLHCYSLKDFHEIFTVNVPEAVGYVRLSDDGKVLLVSGDTGGFWLYAYQ